MNTFDIITKKIIHLENNPFSYEGEKTDNIDYFIKILFMNLNNRKFYKNKFHFLFSAQSGFSGELLGEKGKTDFQNLFYTIQRAYHGFQRFYYLYKYKKAKYIVNTDLCLNPISTDLKDVLCIFQDNNKYLFRARELIKIIETALTNAPGFFCDPLKIKNPYNNMPLNKSTLYNIYFFVKYNTHIYSELFHHFFMCNFNLTKFFLENESLLREYAIDNYIRNGSTIALYMDIIEMLDFYNEECQITHKPNKIMVHEDFPQKELVEIMKPYLKLYLHYIYNMANVKKQHCRRILIKKLIAFNNHNKGFGKKFFKLGRDKETNQVSMIPDFHRDHVKFIPGNNTTFMNSHLEINHNFEEYPEEQERRQTYGTFLYEFLFSFPLSSSNNETDVEETENDENETHDNGSIS